MGKTTSLFLELLAGFKLLQDEPEKPPTKELDSAGDNANAVAPVQPQAIAPTDNNAAQNTDESDEVLNMMREAIGTLNDGLDNLQRIAIGYQGWLR